MHELQIRIELGLFVPQSALIKAGVYLSSDISGCFGDLGNPQAYQSTYTLGWIFCCMIVLLQKDKWFLQMVIFNIIQTTEPS